MERDVESTIRENLARIGERIESVCARTGRSPESVKLVAVSKTVPAERINLAIAAGVAIIGENRVQEAEEKFPRLSGRVERHMVGHLQTNKVKKALELFDWVQSVDSERLAAELQRRAAARDRTVPVLIEVNASGEESKFGVRPEATAELVGKVAELANVEVRGLMTVGPLSPDETTVRRAFDGLYRLFREIGDAPPAGARMEYLSMGMSADYEWAIMAGSNMIRIGSALFGPRSH